MFQIIRHCTTFPQDTRYFLPDQLLSVLKKDKEDGIVLKKDKEDGIVKCMFHLIHSKKLSLYKAEWYVGFKTVTVFEKYGETKPYGEVSLEAGESFEWKKYEDMED